MAEGARVHRQRIGRAWFVEADGGPVGVKPFLTDGLAQSGERAAQGRQGALPIRIRPKKGRQAAAPLWLAGHGQVSQQGNRLARIYFNGNTIALNQRRAEQANGKVTHVLSWTYCVLRTA